MRKSGSTECAQAPITDGVFSSQLKGAPWLSGAPCRIPLSGRTAFVGLYINVYDDTCQDPPSVGRYINHTDPVEPNLPKGGGEGALFKIAPKLN